MRRWAALLLAMLLIVPASLGETVPDGVELEIGGMSILSEWQDEESDTHKWLQLEVRLLNWHTEPVALSECVGAQLTYLDRYNYDAECAFATAEAEPLVPVTGGLLFRIPNMVAEDLGNAQIRVMLGDESVPVGIDANLASASFDERFEGAGFGSPEEAVEAYIEAFDRGDVRGMLSTFAVETAVERMDNRAYIRTMGAVLHSSSLSPVAADNDFSRGIRTYARLADLTGRLSTQYCWMAWPEEAQKGYYVHFRGENAEAEADAFLERFALAPINQAFGKIECLGFIAPGLLAGSDAEARYDRELERYAENYSPIYGWDEVTELAAHIRIDGEDYVQCMRCARFGDRWFNVDPQTSLSRYLQSSSYQTGGLHPMPVEEND